MRVITQHILYNSRSYTGKYAQRFYAWKYEGRSFWAVENGRYVNCRCWYENEKDGLRAKTNPECKIHANE